MKLLEIRKYQRRPWQKTDARGNPDRPWQVFHNNVRVGEFATEGEAETALETIRTAP